MAKTKPLYQEMATNIAAAQWCKEGVEDKWSIWSNKVADNMAAMPKNKNLGETTFDWHKSNADKIVLHSIYHAQNEMQEGIIPEWVSFDVTVVASLMHQAVIVITFPDIRLPYLPYYDGIKQRLQETFTKVFC